MGTVVKYDVTATDGERNAKEYEQPKPGVYTARIKEVKQGFSKTDGKPDPSKPKLEVIMQITSGQYKGGTITDHVPLSSEAAIFRLDQLLLACGIVTPKGKRKGSFNTDQLVGEKVKLRIKGETYNGNYQAKVGGIFKLGEDDEDEAATSEDEEESEESEDEEEETEAEDNEAWWAEIIKWGTDADEGNEKAQADLTLLAEKVGVDVDDYPESWASLAEELDTYDWTTEEIDFGDAEESDDEDEEEETEDEDEEEEETETMDYASMSIGELRAECRNQGLDDKGTKSMVVERLTKHAANPFGEDD